MKNTPPAAQCAIRFKRGQVVNLDQLVSISPQVLAQEVAGEAVLLDLESEHYFGLDAVGTRVWQLIGESGRLRDIQATLLREYEVEESRLRADLTRLLEEFLTRGLIVLHASGAGGRDLPQ